MGIPLGDKASREKDIDGDRSFARRIKIDDGSFHAHRAAKATLEFTSRKCSTKEGRSVEPLRVSQSMGRPSGPAMEVKVPHS